MSPCNMLLADEWVKEITENSGLDVCLIIYTSSLCCLGILWDSANGTNGTEKNMQEFCETEYSIIWF